MVRALLDRGGHKLYESLSCGFAQFVTVTSPWNLRPKIVQSRVKPIDPCHYTMDSALFTAKLEYLYDMLLWIRERAKNCHCTQTQLQRIELASEEALVNIIRHAYGDLSGEVEIYFSSTPNQIEIMFKDEGAYFNPLLVRHQVNHEASLEERQEGGLGILMIKKYMDEVHYDRIDNSNVLTLVKRLS